MRALVFLLALAPTQVQGAPLGPSIIGLDHIPTVVRNLDQASEDYRRLGFTLKPGGVHEDRLRNMHVKFKDGSGIELIAPPSEPTDDLTSYYLQHLSQGDGPAYISFHARNTGMLLSALDSAGIAFEGDDLITLDDPLLQYVFFIRDNRSPTDRPEHFAHPNSSFALSGIWLALDDTSHASLKRLLLALGATASKETVFAPNELEAEVFAVQNGWVIVIPKDNELREGRPIVGAEFLFQETAAANRFLGKVASRPSRYVVAPSVAHGLWLSFDRQP